MAIIVREIPARAYAGVMSDLPNLKQRLLDSIILFQSPTDSLALLRLHEILCSRRDFLVSVGLVRGIAAYARAQEDDPTYDVVTEFNALIATIQIAIDFIVANFPTSTYLDFNPSTNKARYMTIPASQLTAYLTLLQDIADAIDVQ